jgi:hypothetical protein
MPIKLRSEGFILISLLKNLDFLRKGIVEKLWEKIPDFFRTAFSLFPESPASSLCPGVAIRTFQQGTKTPDPGFHRGDESKGIFSHLQRAAGVVANDGLRK